MPAELIVANGRVVTPRATYRADLAVANGRILAIAAPGEVDRTGATLLDATELYVLPGVIDAHVHFREPGLTVKEDFQTGSRSAVMGGVTTVLDMPNTVPPTATAERVRDKQQLLAGRVYADVGLYGLIAPDNLDEIGPMAEAGVVGYKCFLGESTGNLATPDDGTLFEAMQRVAATGKRLAFHAEANALLQAATRRVRASGRTDPLAHVDARPILAEVEAIQRVCLLASESDTRIHILHLTSREGLATIEAWRSRGVDVTTEVSAHHCFLTAEDMQRLGALLRVNPPVRAAGHGEALLQALGDGRIELIASDHAPHEQALKQAASIWGTVSGFAGVETTLPLFLTEGVNKGRLTLQRLVAATSENPARVWGLYPRKGAIQVGSDADLTLVDLHRAGRIEAARLHGKNNHTPFEGWETIGQPVATIVRGQVVMRDGALVGEPRGRALLPET